MEISMLIIKMMILLLFPFGSNHISVFIFCLDYYFDNGNGGGMAWNAVFPVPTVYKPVNKTDEANLLLRRRPSLRFLFTLLSL